MENTDKEKSHAIPPLDISSIDELNGENIEACCIKTIEELVINNPMMVCTECKQLIKCYRDGADFLNYIKFCESRKRPVTTGKVLNFYTIVFNTYY